MDFEKIVEEVDKVEGWFAYTQQAFLYQYVKDLKPDSLLVEIGTAHGRSSRFFSLVNPDIRIITVDIVPCEVKDNVKQIVGKSDEVGKAFEEKIDFLFIDGNHTKEGVKSDIETWIPLVKKGGYVAFHDFGTLGQWKGDNRVAEVVTDWLAGNKDFEDIACKSCVYIVKRK